MTARPEDASEIRKKLLEIGQAADRAAFEVNKNPLYALFALGRYHLDEEPPLWVRQWLLGFIREVGRIAVRRLDQQLSSAEAVEEVHRALGLTRQGWNAFDELQRNLNDDLLAFLRGQGIAVADIAVMLPSPADDREGVEPAGIYRRTNRAYARWPRVGPRRRPRAKK